MTKKIFALALVACVLGTIIAGCGNKDADTTPAATATTGTTTGATPVK